MSLSTHNYYTSISIAVVVVLVFVSVLTRAKDRNETVRCSVIQLIATPQEFDSKRVQTFGFATIGLERDFLYLSREDANHGIVMNAVLLDLETFEKAQQYSQLDREYVLVEGRFDASHRSGFAPANGGLREITRLELLGPIPTLDKSSSQSE